MSFIVKYRAVKAQEYSEHKARTAEHNRIQEEQKKQILAVLAKAGVQPYEVQTNGYWFHFTHKGMYVDFVNQTERLCGQVYRLPRNDEEKEVLRDANMIVLRKNDLADEFRREFLYEDFVLYGNPASVVSKVLKLAEKETS